MASNVILFLYKVKISIQKNWSTTTTFHTLLKEHIGGQEHIGDKDLS